MYQGFLHSIAQFWISKSAILHSHSRLIHIDVEPSDSQEEIDFSKITKVNEWYSTDQMQGIRQTLRVNAFVSLYKPIY